MKNLFLLMASDDLSGVYNALARLAYCPILNVRWYVIALTRSAGLDDSVLLDCS